MRAMAKSNVRVGIAGDVEVVGIAKLLWIAVGRADHRQNQFLGRDHLAMYLDVAPRLPEYRLQRRAETQNLFDHRWQSAWCLLEAVKLVWVFDQTQDCIADKVCGRFTAGQQQKLKEAQDFLLCKPFAVDLGRD